MIVPAAAFACDPHVSDSSRTDNCVGQRSLAVTADTYTHVLLDDRELDHSLLVGQ